jgi:hypothetical protein
MTTAPGRSRCITCGKEKATSKCSECLKDFRYNHLEVNHDLFQPTLNEQIAKPRKHALIQQINQWEKNSMNKI